MPNPAWETSRVTHYRRVPSGYTVELLLGGSSLAHPVLHTVTAADITAGNVSLTVTAGDLGADGSKSLSAKFTDTAGNTSTTGALAITLDTAALPPSTPDLKTASDSGSSSTDNITNVTTPIFTGTAEGNATVKLFDGVTQIGSTTANNGGNWSITSSAL